MGNEQSHRKLFSELDEDKDGDLTLEELMQVSDVPGVNSLFRHSPLLFFQFDNGEDGSLNTSEFEKMLKYLRKYEKDALIKQKTRKPMVESTSKSPECWTSLDATKAINIDFSRNRETPALTGRMRLNEEENIVVGDTESEAMQAILQQHQADMKHFLYRLLNHKNIRKRFMKWLFRLADVDRDDDIGEQELALILKALEVDGIKADNLAFVDGDQLTLAKRLLEQYDTTGSGSLTRKEFMVLADLIMKQYEQRIATSKNHPIIGPYVLRRKLGTGSVGVVRLAVKIEDRKRYAAKIIERKDVSDMTRLDTEIKAMMMLNHPSIVRLYEVLETNTTVYFIMELCIAQGSLILTSSGLLRKIESIEVAHEVVAYDTTQKDVQNRCQVSRSMYIGNKACIAIQLEVGITLRMTPDHPIFVTLSTLQEGGYKEAGKVVGTDYEVVCSRFSGVEDEVEEGVQWGMDIGEGIEVLDYGRQRDRCLSFARLCGLRGAGWKYVGNARDRAAILADLQSVYQYPCEVESVDKLPKLDPNVLTDLPAGMQREYIAAYMGQNPIPVDRFSEDRTRTIAMECMYHSIVPGEVRALSLYAFGRRVNYRYHSAAQNELGTYVAWVRYTEQGGKEDLATFIARTHLSEDLMKVRTVSQEDVGTLPVYDLTIPGPHNFMVEGAIVKNCGGGTLSEYIEFKPMSEGFARFYLKQLITGMIYCHKRGVCHRDLKLENMILDNDGNLKITDFGHAGIYSKGWDLFSTGLVGSMYHLAPEQITGQAYSGVKRDIWGVGIILYRLLTGKSPFFSNNAPDLFRRIQELDYVIPSHVSEEASDLIRKILQVDPDDRLSLRKIQKHAWFSGEVTKPSLMKFVVALFDDGEPLLGIERCWEGFVKCVKSRGVHVIEEGEGEKLLKCVYPKRDMKFSVALRTQKKKKKKKKKKGSVRYLLAYKLWEGESSVFTYVAHKIERSYKRWERGHISPGSLSLSSPKPVKKERLKEDAIPLPSPKKKMISSLSMSAVSPKEEKARKKWRKKQAEKRAKRHLRWDEDSSSTSLSSSSMDGSSSSSSTESSSSLSSSDSNDEEEFYRTLSNQGEEVDDLIWPAEF